MFAKMKYLKPAAFLLFFSLIAGSGLRAQQSIKWGKVPVDDLQMQAYPSDTSAEAAVLFERGDIRVYSSSDGSYYRFDVYQRLKLFRSSAFERANISRPYFSKQGAEKIYNLRARVTLPSGQYFELEKEDFLREETSEEVTTLKFTFPKLEEGAVIEYGYSIDSKLVTTLPTWFFQTDIPVRYSEVTLENESYFSYATLFETGTDMEQQQQSEEHTVLAKGPTEIHLKPGHYWIEDAPAIVAENFLTTISDYRARIRFQISKFNRPDGYVKEFMSSWEQTATDLIEAPYFGHMYTKRRNYRKLLKAAAPVLEKEEGEAAKLASLYRFLGESVEWDGTFCLVPERPPDEAFEQGSGSSCELSLMLVALLKEAGITSYPLLTSTRSHGEMTQQYPIIEQFNHVLVYAEPGGKGLVLDTPRPYKPLGMIHPEALNGLAWAVSEAHPIWIEVPIPGSSTQVAAELQLSQDGSAEGEVKASYRGLDARSERLQALENRDDQPAYWAEKFALNVAVDSISYTDLRKPSIDFDATAKLSFPAAANAINDFLYVKPLLPSAYLESPLRRPERNYPVDFVSPFVERLALKLQLPEGYTIEELPAPQKIVVGEGAATYFYRAKARENSIRLFSMIEVKKLRIEPDDYPALKALFDQMAETLNAQLVLKKQ